MVKYNWDLPARVVINEQYPELHIPSYLMRVLNNRGYTTKSEIVKFLNPRLSNLGNPFAMHDMRKGLAHIRRAIRNHTKITIYGDYDVDGMTSTSIMYILLKHFHANVHYFIPNRFRDGYGPNLDEYKRIIKNGTKLLITVDNGISGLKQITYAKKHGMDVIITDHHDFPPKLPPADEIIMGKYPGHQYHHGREDFCGAGIAFKIATAMLGYVPKDLLDLAALGTVADIVSLTYEDRIIVANGLKSIHHSHRPGIIALGRVADVDLSKLSSTDLSFSLIPRLNALGRMSDANIAVKLFTTHSMKEAMSIARRIEKCNRERQTIMHRESKEAMAQANLPANRKRCTLVLYNPKWFPGTVGIDASQVGEHFYKPTIIIGHLNKGKYIHTDDAPGRDRGSGRSIKEFNLSKAMNPLRKYMVSFGGHPLACGLTVMSDKIKYLRVGLERAGIKAGLEHVVPTIHPDLIMSPQQINKQTMAQFERLEPFGQDNEAPLVVVHLPRVYNVQQMGRDNMHLRFTFGESYSSTHVVAWHMGKYFHNLAKNPYGVEIAGELEYNHYKGRTYLQFKVEHMRRYAPTVPVSRYQIGVVYKFLRDYRPQTRYADYVQNILIPFSRSLGCDVKLTTAAIQILIELHLVTNNNGVLKVNPHPARTKLTQSRTYRYNNAQL